MRLNTTFWDGFKHFKRKNMRFTEKNQAKSN